MRMNVAALVLLWALSSGAAEPIRAALPGLTGVNVPGELVEFYGEHLGQQLVQQGLRVTTRKQIGALVGWERQRQLLGCSDDSACVVELGGALGADVLIVGEVARVGRVLQFNIKALDTRTGTPLSVFSARVEGDDLVLATLDRAARRMAGELTAPSGRPLLTDAPGPQATTARTETVALTSGPRQYAWMPALLGAVAGGVGTYFYLRSRASYGRLTAASGTPLDGQTADRLRDDGRLQQTIGVAGIGTAAAALVTAGVLFALGGSSSTVEGGVTWGTGGAGVQLAGVLP